MKRTRRQIAMPSKTQPKPARLFTVSEVARLDNVSEKTVRRAIEAGRLEVVRVGPSGRLIRIHPDAHAAYQRGRNAASAPEARAAYVEALRVDPNHADAWNGLGMKLPTVIAPAGALMGLAQSEDILFELLEQRLKLEPIRQVGEDKSPDRPTLDVNL